MIKAIMRRLIAKLSFIVTFFSVLIIALFYFFQSNYLQKFSPFLGEELSRLLQQPINLSGPIKIKIFPQFGIHVPLVKITETKNASSYRMLLKDVFFKCDLSSFFLKQTFEFDELRIAKLFLAINASANNVLKKQPSLPTKKTLSLFQINKILIQEGNIQINHPNYLVEVKNLILQAKHLNFYQTAFPVQLSSHIQISSPDLKHLLSANFNFKGLLSLSPILFSTRQMPLAHLSINGDMSASEIAYNHFHIDSIFTSLKTTSTTLLLNPIHFSLYHGESFGDMNINMLSQQVFLNQIGRNFEIESLLKDLFPKNKLYGHLGFSMHMLFNYHTDSLLKGLSGNGNIVIQDGYINGFNLSAILNYAKEKLSKLLNQTPDNVSPPPHLNPDQVFQSITPFRMINLTYHIHRHDLKSNHFVFENNELKLSASGTYNLTSNDISAMMNAKIQSDDAQTQKAQQLFGGSFPLSIDGQITSPHIQPDMPKISPHIQALILNKVINTPFKTINEQLLQLFQFQSISE